MRRTHLPLELELLSLREHWLKLILLNLVELRRSAAVKDSGGWLDMAWQRLKASFIATVWHC